MYDARYLLSGFLMPKIVKSIKVKTQKQNIFGSC